MRRNLDVRKPPASRDVVLADTRTRLVRDPDGPPERVEGDALCVLDAFKRHGFAEDGGSEAVGGRNRERMHFPLAVRHGAEVRLPAPGDAAEERRDDPSVVHSRNRLKAVRWRRLAVLTLRARQFGKIKGFVQCNRRGGRTRTKESTSTKEGEGQKSRCLSGRL